jgi:hypothetical protein
VADATRSFEVVHNQQRLIFRCGQQKEALEWVEDTMGVAEEIKKRCAQRRHSFVYLNIYDCTTNRLLHAFNSVAKNVFGIGGVFHAGVELYGAEYSFGGFDFEEDMAARGLPVVVRDVGTGVVVHKPLFSPNNNFRQSECLGLIGHNKYTAQQLIEEMACMWPTQDYQLLGPNCVTFCRALCLQLELPELPDWIDALARAVRKTHYPVHCKAGHECTLQLAQTKSEASVPCNKCNWQIWSTEARWRCADCPWHFCVRCVEDPTTPTPRRAARRGGA